MLFFIKIPLLHFFVVTIIKSVIKQFLWLAGVQMSYFVSKIRHLGRPPFLQSYILCEPGSRCRESRCPTLFPKLDISTPVATVLYTVRYRGSRCRGSKFRGSRCRGSRCRGSRCRGSRCRGSRCRGSRCRGSRCRGSRCRGSRCRGSRCPIPLFRKAVKVGYILKFIKFTYSS